MAVGRRETEHILQTLTPATEKINGIGEMQATQEHCEFMQILS